MTDIITNWQAYFSVGALLISLGGFIYMIKDHGKRLEKLEKWKDDVVDDRLSTIEKKIDLIIEAQKGKDDVLAEKLKNILEKINNRNCGTNKK